MILSTTSIVILAAVIHASHALPEYCSNPPLPHSACGFYVECLENFYPCGVNGYAIGYGYKYCNRFSSDNMSECMDDAGDEWVNSTLSCLQQALLPITESNDTSDFSCRSIKVDAFDSHSICYTGGGLPSPLEPSVCFLPYSDVRCILGTIDPKDLLSPLGLQEDIETAKICISQHQQVGFCDDGEGFSDNQQICDFWSLRLRTAQSLQNRDKLNDKRASN